MFEFENIKMYRYIRYHMYETVYIYGENYCGLCHAGLLLFQVIHVDDICIYEMIACSYWLAVGLVWPTYFKILIPVSITLSMNDGQRVVRKPELVQSFSLLDLCMLFWPVYLMKLVIVYLDTIIVQDRYPFVLWFLELKVLFVCLACCWAFVNCFLLNLMCL